MHSRSLRATCGAMLLACSSHRPANAPGPAEKAGAAIDNGAKDAQEATKNAAHHVGNATEKAGNKLKEKTSDH